MVGTEENSTGTTVQRAKTIHVHVGSLLILGNSFSAQFCFRKGDVTSFCHHDERGNRNPINMNWLRHSDESLKAVPNGSGVCCFENNSILTL